MLLSYWLSQSSLIIAASYWSVSQAEHNMKETDQSLIIPSNVRGGGGRIERVPGIGPGAVGPVHARNVRDQTVVSPLHLVVQSPPLGTTRTATMPQP